ncbi:AAA family ATPase [Kocuria rhizophila]|uniref:AAA family ATPase n=1 Tax=Kocuria rhizophila TaxID=72000 RepID=UPI00386A3E6C|nr:AAA family ATPase [Kocuria rhizophila]WSZ54152.1 AAA family ATPase [Kocuria rhizophila]
MSKIIRLQSTNYKRLKAVEITPDKDGNLVIVAGKNGQGKSSVLDSITAALGGVNAKTTPKPIRDGEDRAEIVLETEDLVVTRRFTPSGSTLKVTSPDGATYPKAQARLDDLLGKLSLDPLAFTQLSDREQLATLLDLVELPFDPAELDAQRKAVFERRTEVNRQVKDAEARVKGFTVTEKVEPVSVADLLTEYRAEQAVAEKQEADLRRADEVAEQIGELEQRLAELRATRDELANTISGHRDLHLDRIQGQIDNAEQINAQAREFKAYEEARDRLEGAQHDAEKLTFKLARIDKTKAEGLAAARFPIPGLGFEDGGVSYQGVPFKQASSAEQLRVSLAMAIALNPSLRVIRIADGSLLDSDNLALIESMAREHDFQVWIEMVDDSGERGIVIEDGEVA